MPTIFGKCRAWAPSIPSDGNFAVLYRFRVALHVDAKYMCFLNEYAVFKQESAASDTHFVTMFAAFVHADQAVGPPLIMLNGEFNAPTS